MRKWISLNMLLLAVLAVSACRPKTVVVEREVTRIVTREQIVEHTVVVPREVTRIVIQRETVQVEITPTSTPIPEGGTLRLTSLTDAEILNPLLSDDGASADIESLIWDGAFQIDPWSGETIPGLVDSWEIAGGNQRVTYHVRQGMRWSDGEPITARDFQFMYDALLAQDEAGVRALADSPHMDMVQDVEKVTLLDDYTLQVDYSQPLCANVDAMSLRWLPSHIYLQDPDFKFSDLVNDDRNWAPTVFSGPFMLQEWAPDDRIVLARNPAYWQGAPHLDSITWQVVPDVNTQIHMLKTGEADLGAIDPQFVSEIEQVAEVDIYRLMDTAYDYILFQQGDPDHPQPRLNEDGTLNTEHGSHPILGNKQVRQALAHAIDRIAVLNQVRAGQGTLMNAHIEPIYGWTYHSDLQARAYDPQKAALMMEDAGWVLNTETGVRECQGCGTTEDGTEMRLSLKTNIGDGEREDIGVLVRQQLEDVGVQVDLEPLKWIPFLDVLLSQSFDMAIGGWRGGSEDKSILFRAENDRPSAGFNMGSFYNPEYEKLSLEAQTLEGCSTVERGEVYRQIQEILSDEQPYVWLYALRRITVVNRRLVGVNPGPWSTTHNIHEWYVR